MSIKRLGTARPVCAVTAIATTIIGHAIRTSDTALPGHWMWWGWFFAASWACLYAAVRPSRRSVGIAGAFTITVAVSRAFAVIVDSFIFDSRNATAPLLAITLWLWIAYYAAHVFHRLTSRQGA